VFIQHRHDGDKSWIGLNDRSVEGSFVWTNKEISRFRFWAPKQPNDWNNEDCVHTLGAKHGYTWNDVPCNNCFNFTCFTDLDECSTHTHNCDVNADCINTVGSYSCTCKAGYSGDGQTCTDVDECSSNSHSCDVNAVCSNTRGSHTCTCKAGYSGDGRSCSAVECTSYSSLTNGDRKTTYIIKSRQCDRNLNGWYRFQGAAGTRMPTSCPPEYRCDTDATGWLNGGHPTVADGKVTRQVCFHWFSNCCNWSSNIQVRNCGSFYVYHFSGTPYGCALRYCGSD